MLFTSEKIRKIDTEKKGFLNHPGILAIKSNLKKTLSNHFKSLKGTYSRSGVNKSGSSEQSQV